MPDRDVFDRNVRPGWRSASRLLIGTAEDDDLLRSVIRALGKEIKRDGCPGFEAIVQIVISARRSSDHRHAQRWANEQLEQLRREQASSITEVATNSAKRLLVRPPAMSLDEPQPLTVAAEVLGDLAAAWLCPAPLMASLVEEGHISFQDFRFRRERAKAIFVSSPEFQRLANMLLADPSGTSVRTPQMRRPKISQADILVTAITD